MVDIEGGALTTAIPAARMVLIELCDFEAHPIGGQLNFARLLQGVFGPDLATVGYPTSDDEPIGVWFRKEMSGVTRWHFNIGRMDFASKYLVPRRFQGFMHFLRWRSRIRAIECRRFFLQEHVLLMGFRRSAGDTVVYRFPGVESQLAKSRFTWAKAFSKAFDIAVFASCRKADHLLASADQSAIEAMRASSLGLLGRRQIERFPTRVDPALFHPAEQPATPPPWRFVSTGRIHWVKGWQLMLDALRRLPPDLAWDYTYIGEGPDREALLGYAKAHGISDRVSLPGRMAPAGVAAELRRADVYLMGSHMEGWPTSLVEAYACGVPIVTTPVSGAADIVENGVTGFITPGWQADEFAAAIGKAMRLDRAAVKGRLDVSRYSTETLRRQIEEMCDAVERQRSP